MNLQCSCCPKTFSRRSSLRNHIKIHDTDVGKHLRETSIERCLREIEEERNNLVASINKQLETRFDSESIIGYDVTGEEIMNITENETDEETDVELNIRKGRKMDVEINVREMDIDIRDEAEDEREMTALDDERETSETDEYQV